ncbi:MAG: two-component regulator propeller domain-containing protein, partial [Bacteroidota bacterium]
MKQQYYYTLIFLFGAQVLLFAQQTLMVQQIDRTDGLSQNSVMAIAQDGDGYIWLATRDGLNKYDGYQFTHFRQDPTKPKSSLPSNDVRSLYFDSLTNQLWIGTAEGVSSYDIYNHQFKNYLTIEAYEQNFLVNSIFKDQAKKLWLCTTRGLILLDEEDGSIEKIDLNDLEANVRAIYQSKNEKTVRWVGTHRGLFIVKEENGQFVAQAAEDYIPSLSFFKRLRIATITEDINGDLWFGTERNGIFQFKRTNNEILKFQHDADDPNSLSHNNIRTVINSPDAKLYIGTLVGLNIYDTKTKQLSPLKLEQKNITKQSLSNNSIRTLFFDQNKSLWLGTYFGGVNYHDPRLNRFQVHRYKADENSINFNVISSFQEDAKGNLWIGTEGGGLNYLDRTTGTYKHYEYQENNRRSLSGNNVKTILQDESGLWVGTFQNGLCFTDDITKGFQRFQYKSLDHSNPNNNNIYSLLRRDNELWIATLGGGLNRMNITEKTFKYYKTDASDSLSIVSNSCRLVFEDQLSNIWIGTEGGLDLVEFVTPDSLIFKHYLKGIKIYSIAQIEKKGIWIGSAGNGLLYFDLESKTYYNPVQEHSLMQGTVYGILAENGQKLWLSTSNGIFTYDIEHKIFNTYSAAYGLEKLEYNFNAYHKDQQGKFYFGSTNGYISFEPKDIESKASDAPLVFTYLDAMGKRVEVGEENALLATDINQSTEITFKYNQANFKIGFAKLDYFNPKNNQYRYQMEDIDQRWITIQGQAEATYTIQRPGTYNFRLKASNSDGIWSEEERNIKFIVRPPWWRSIWAYIAYGSIAIFLIWALRRYYLLQASYRLEQLSKQKQAEINEMKLRFFTNITHEFRTPLTLILSP